ncbi:MAG: GNAT family N-acetyltransferase [Marinifilaceae bacterium]
MPIFTTKRLFIRELEEKDPVELLKIYNCQENMQYVSSGKWHWSKEELDEKLRKHTLNYPKGYGIFMVEEKESGKLIGEVGLFNSFNSERELEIGYILDRKYWGLGFGSELINGLIEYGIDILRLHRIMARMYAQNLASARVCEKCGMRLVEKGVSESGVSYLEYEFLSSQRSG